MVKVPPEPALPEVPAELLFDEHALAVVAIRAAAQMHTATDLACDRGFMRFSLTVPGGIDRYLARQAADPGPSRAGIRDGRLPRMVLVPRRPACVPRRPACVPRRPASSPRSPAIGVGHPRSIMCPGC